MLVREIFESNPDIMGDFIKGLDKNNDFGAPAVIGKSIKRKTSKVVTSGPPYPKEDIPAVKLIQTKLQALGYSLGRYGADGKYGPVTARAIRAWKQDNNLRGTALEMSKADIETLLSTNKMSRNKFKAQRPDELAGLASANDSTATDSETTPGSDSSLADARKSAESYLGREMSDNEWNYLVRATIAEASQNTKERGYVMAVILNRARNGYNGDTDIVDILKQPRQFQAVTGTKYDPGPSKHFTRKPSNTTLASIVQAATEVLPKADKSFMNFTAADPKAYGKGTNINFLKQLKDKGGVTIGKTVFGTV